VLDRLWLDTLVVKREQFLWRFAIAVSVAPSPNPHWPPPTHAMLWWRSPQQHSVAGATGRGHEFNRRLAQRARFPVRDGRL